MTDSDNIPLQYRAFLKSPPLLKPGMAGHEQFRFRSLEKEERYGITHLPINLVFGKRIERFFSHYIDTSEDYEMLAENLQVIKDKVTLGEIDFLLKEKGSDSILHVELAFKFYLYLDEDIPDEFSKWAGPNRRDFLSKKLEKLRERQFPLLYKDETKSLLNSLGINADEVQQQLCLQGFLFMPFQWREKLPPAVNPEALKGFWLRAADFTKERFGAGKFHLPEKQDWIIPPGHAPHWQSFSEFETLVSQRIAAKKSPMCWMKSKADEYQLFFIVWW